MRSSSVSAAAALSLALRASAQSSDESWINNYRFGNMFYSGPTSGGAYITKATYSMTPPAIPCGYATNANPQEELALWIGAQEDPTGKDVLKLSFVQPLLNWAPDQQMTGCDSTADNWCITASTYHPSGQVNAGYKPVAPNTALDFEIAVDEASTNITQKVWKGGELISSQSDNPGLKLAVFYSGNECYGADCGTLNGYSWSNITVTLNKADKNFGNTLSLTGATSDGFTTSDGGVTWHAEEIRINEDYFYQDGSKKECSS
ncbi:hypothetical protein B0J12DRAFT_683201 [Macrophomina phaseolina]|uniref:Concanavalin A-like lectin/glucanase n=1 Tax=Macrophomina phaseolina TaxID=35725 RepID=A0ABQ8FV79_9PEZI|nr:hypothetical protein B0J12DRAFT_683201 [Macrophomina phaseolina]